MELIHLIVGTEKFLIEKQVENIIKGVFGEEIEENSISKYDMLEDSINTAIEDCETIPFFSDKKIVIINNPFFLTGETPKTEVVHNLEIFENYLNNPVAQTILIIVAPYEKFDERKKITKLVKKVSKIYKIETLNDKKLFSSVKKIFTDRGYNVEDEAISLLISMVGTDFTLILEEIKKILLFKDENKDITTEDIRLLVSRTLEQNVFHLIDNIVSNNKKEALTIYNDLLAQGEEPVKLIAFLGSQLQLIYKTLVLSEKGLKEEEISTKLKVHPYRVKLAKESAQKFKKEKLIKYIEELADLDYDIKRGIIDKRLGFELFLLRSFEAV